MSAMTDAVWDALPILALVICPDDTILEANSEVEDFLKTSVKSLRGAPLLDRLTIDSPIEDAFARVRQNRAALFVNNVDVGSKQRPAESCNIQIAPISGDSGCLLVLMTPRQMAGRLSKAGSARSSARSAIGMAEMLAHEIKNPLAGIKGAAQLLSMNLSNDDLQMTDLIVEESRRIVALLDQVEQFGNLRPPARRAVNVHDLVDRALRTAGVGMAAHMRIIQEYDPSLPPTYVDEDRMQQVLLNLIRNAVQAAGSNQGEIRMRTFYDHALRLRDADGQGHRLPIQIEVIDDGPGLPPDLADMIFDPFVSGRENGTGLGLALVSKIVSEHDGLISVDSRPGRTAFLISLPLAPKDLEED